MSELIEYKESDEPKQEAENLRTDWKTKFWIPVSLILISGIVGIIVAYTWEHFKFKREILFERNLDYVIDSRNQAIDIYTSIDRIRRTIRTNETNTKGRGSICHQIQFKEDREEIRIQARKINYLSDFTKGIFESDSIPIYVNEFKDRLRPYLECLQQEKFKCECTKTHSDLLDPLNNVIRMHTKEINSKIR